MRFIIRGTVQGVGFRPAVYRAAEIMGLRGRVYNDGASVIIETDGNFSFIEELKRNLPALAVIESVDAEEYELPFDVVDFSIVESSKTNSGIGIPADTAVCDNCLKDMKEGRRKGYAFTTCTECGARFTLMSSNPYDRVRTSMDAYPMCDSCKSEYSDPGDRRFHHQTVCCEECGPSYYVLDSEGNRIDGEPLSVFADFIEKGKIGIIKGWGGMHICSSLKHTQELREWYGRANKPFAVMVKDTDALIKYSDPTDVEFNTVTSPQRPIVLIKKKDTIPEAVSPGLDNVGIFLPYTGIQHLLFERMNEDALIMTSANVPGEPMILKDEDVLSMEADIYLLHNQEIINRADDSVVKFAGKNRYFLRKARGYIPSYIDIGMNGDVVALGPQENLTASVTSKGRIYTTQHIGNGESIGVLEFLESATGFFMDTLETKPSVIAVDLHPGYQNRRFASRLSEETGAEIVEIQHHWAHCASLMADAGIDEISCLSVDGTGHGTDGNAWGGEVMSADYEKFERVAHLEYIPLLGGEKALHDIRRLFFAINSINGKDSDFVTEKEAEIFTKMISASVKTSSLGRILDALSYSLGICDYRTYDGEPAMKIEPYLSKGKLIDGFETDITDGTIGTAHLFSQIDTNCSKADTAYTIVKTIVDKMTESAADSLQNGVRHIGITGGVSYSVPITEMFVSKVKELGYEPVLHNRVPNGDGGISVGQAAIALKGLR